VAWIWANVLAGDGTAMWVETTAKTGAETGARAGVGTRTGEGREAEAGIWAALEAATWAAAMNESGARAGAWLWIWA